MQSGQITVASAGTAEQGPSEGGYIFALKGHPSNTNQMWVGNVSEDVSNANGFPLAAGETLIIKITNLSFLWVDAGVNGEKLCWIRVV